MKKKNNSYNLIRYIGKLNGYIGKLIKPKKSYGKYERLEKHQPSWMYRNE